MFAHIIPKGCTSSQFGREHAIEASKPSHPYFNSLKKYNRPDSDTWVIYARLYTDFSFFQEDKTCYNMSEFIAFRGRNISIFSLNFRVQF